MLMGAGTWRWRLLVPGVLCLGLAFLSFLGGREHWSEVVLGTLQLRCHCCGCYSLGKSQGATRTVGHLASYLAPFPFSLSTCLGFFFSFLGDRVCCGGGVAGQGGSWASLSTSALSWLGPAPSWFSKTSPAYESLPGSRLPAAQYLGSLVGVFSLNVISRCLSFCSYRTDQMG